MISAQEAKRQTDQNRKDLIQEQIKDIEGLIEVAISQSRYSISYSKELHTNTIYLLEENGYIVSQHGKEPTTISWSHV